MPSTPSVLIVDDNSTLRESIGELLEMEGYPVLTAGNGKEALEILKTYRPKLILLDLFMPVMNGWEFSRIQKSDPELSKIPLLVFCADRNFPNYSLLKADGFIPKPFNVDDLLAIAKPYLS